MDYKNSIFNILISKQNNTVLVFNSATGSFVELTIFEYECLINNSFPDKELYANLIAQGFLVPKDLDEYNKIVFNESKFIYGATNHRLVFVIAPTLNCNMKCVYCFENSKNISHNMTAETEDNVVNFIKTKLETTSDTKNVFVSWFGGEPMLCYDLIKRLSKTLIELCEKRNINYNAMMITNGALLTKEKAVALKECKVNRVQITLDGDETTYCKIKGVSPNVYQTVIQNIKDISNIIEVSVRLNCTGDNINELISLVKKFDSYSNIKFYLAHVKNYNSALDESSIAQFSESDYAKCNEMLLHSCDSKNIIISSASLKPIGTSCAVIRTKNNVIGPDGELYCCEHDLGIKDRIIGDVVNGIYFNNYFMEKIKLKHPKRCQKCEIFPICLSGCQSELNQLGRTLEYCKNKKTKLKSQLIEIYSHT